MMLAIASRFVEDDRIFMPMSDTQPQGAQQSRGFDFFKSGSNAGGLSLTSSTLYDLQSSALSIIWLCGAASPISAWASVGFSIRRAVDVGAHREVRSRWSQSPLDDQLRKRACEWVSLIRYVSELIPVSEVFTLYGLDREPFGRTLSTLLNLLRRNSVFNLGPTNCDSRRRYRPQTAVSLESSPVRGETDDSLLA